MNFISKILIGRGGIFLEIGFSAYKEFFNLNQVEGRFRGGVKILFDFRYNFFPKFSSIHL